MANAICPSVIGAEVIRIVRLDDCGLPVTGAASAVVVMDAFTTIENAPNYEEGQRFLLRKANGAPCVNQKGPGFLNWVDQTTSLCTLDPTALALVSGDRLISDGVTGVGVAFGSGLLDQRYSLEVWQPIAGTGVCDEGGAQQYVYWAFGNVFDAQYQNFTFQNDTFEFAWKGTTSPMNSAWDLGADWLDDTNALPLEEGEHFLFSITSVPPPTPSCGATTYVP